MTHQLGLAAILSLGLLISCKSNEVTFTGNTPGGYPYVMHLDKEGKTPQVGDKIVYKRQIKKIVMGQDSILDPSREGTIVLPPAEQVGTPLPPDYELILMMSPGDSASVWQFGDKLPENPYFKPTDTIVYEMVLMDIPMTKEELEKMAEESKARESEVAALIAETLGKFKSGALSQSLKKVESGLQYFLHEEGTGDKVQQGDMVEVHYYGVLMNGNMFDNSFARGEPFRFQVGMGQVIPGWDEGLSLLKEGDKATIFIPSKLGYGDAGAPPNIPGKSDLAFYVEIVKTSR